MCQPQDLVTYSKPKSKLTNSVLFYKLFQELYYFQKNFKLILTGNTFKEANSLQLLLNAITNALNWRNGSINYKIYLIIANFNVKTKSEFITQN